jgi:plasmid stabilization system protein ParE
MRVVYGERARDDIARIYDSIALHNPVAAQAVEDLIRATCEALSEFPYASAATDEPGVRRIPLVRFPYTIFFRVNATSEVVEIARVLHAARVRDLGKMPDDD